MKEKYDTAGQKTIQDHLTDDELAKVAGGTGPEPEADPVRDPESRIPGHVTEPVVDHPGNPAAGAMDRIALEVDKVRAGLTRLMTGVDRK